MTRTVFVVDEDFDGRHALGDLLEDHGWEAVRLSGPREALAALAHLRPALVVTELWRPATPDGASFAALLAETGRARSSSSPPGAPGASWLVSTSRSSPSRIFGCCFL